MKILYGNTLEALITFIVYHYFYFFGLETNINRYYLDMLNYCPSLQFGPFIPTRCDITSKVVTTRRISAGGEGSGIGNK